LGPDVAERVVALTMRNPPGEVTHWIGATMASCSISASVVRRIRRPEARIVPPTTRLATGHGYSQQELWQGPDDPRTVHAGNETRQARHAVLASLADQARLGLPMPVKVPEVVELKWWNLKPTLETISVGIRIAVGAAVVVRPARNMGHTARPRLA